jgi:hypothetical protein
LRFGVYGQLVLICMHWVGRTLENRRRQYLQLEINVGDKILTCVLLLDSPVRPTTLIRHDSSTLIR